MILVLAGPVHSGKTTFLRELLSNLEALKLPVSGYLSPLVMIEGKTAGYDLFDIRKRQSIPFLRTEGEAGWQKVGPYYFLPSGLERAEAVILGYRPGNILIVDEVGPAELSGRGVWPALSEVLPRPSFKCLLVVRKTLLDDLRGYLGNRQIEVFDMAVKDIFPALLERLSKSGVGARTRKPNQKGRAVL
jgi:nucleoside-triphosphatase THEP1